MKKLIVANWKMNGSVQALKLFAKSDIIAKQSLCDVVICPPSIYIQNAHSLFENSITGAQDCCEIDDGPRTGEISARMLSEFNVNYVILGHSERRLYQNESNDRCVSKIKIAQENGLSPIFCIGEKFSDVEKGHAEDVILHQLDSLTVHSVDFTNLTIAYEPIWSIGTGSVPDNLTIAKTMNLIRNWLIENAGIRAGNTIRLLYGGSVNEHNAHEILRISNVDGVLVGGASLKRSSFENIITSCSLDN